MTLFYKDRFFMQHIHIYIYILFLFFRTAVLRKSFHIRFSCKHCNFSRGCLLARRLPKPWQGLLFLACLGGVRKGGERNLCAGEFPTIPLITHAVQANLFFLFGAREQVPWVPEDIFFLIDTDDSRRSRVKPSNRKHVLFHIRYFENGPLEPG